MKKVQISFDNFRMAYRYVPGTGTYLLSYQVIILYFYFFVDSNFSPKILTKLYFVTGISFHSVNKLVADMPQQMTWRYLPTQQVYQVLCFFPKSSFHSIHFILKNFIRSNFSILRVVLPHQSAQVHHKIVVRAVLCNICV